MRRSQVLRPKVGMRQMMAVPYVAALGICDSLPNAGIAWPYTVVDRNTCKIISTLEARGGYDDQGMFVKITYDVREDVEQCIQRRVEVWAASPAPLPLASVLDDYANKLVKLGEGVQVVYPNGNLYARGTFVGVDVWGRATVRLELGDLIEFAPEKFGIR